MACRSLLLTACAALPVILAAAGFFEDGEKPAHGGTPAGPTRVRSNVLMRSEAAAEPQLPEVLEPQLLKEAEPQPLQEAEPHLVEEAESQSDKAVGPQPRGEAARQRRQQRQQHEQRQQPREDAAPQLVKEAESQLVTEADPQPPKEAEPQLVKEAGPQLLTDAEPQPCAEAAPQLVEEAGPQTPGEPRVAPRVSDLPNFATRSSTRLEALSVAWHAVQSAASARLLVHVGNHFGVAVTPPPSGGAGDLFKSTAADADLWASELFNNRIAKEAAQAEKEAAAAAAGDGDGNTGDSQGEAAAGAGADDIGFQALAGMTVEGNGTQVSMNQTSRPALQKATSTTTDADGDGTHNSMSQVDSNDAQALVEQARLLGLKKMAAATTTTTTADEDDIPSTTTTTAAPLSKSKLKRAKSWGNKHANQTPAVEGVETADGVDSTGAEDSFMSKFPWLAELTSPAGEDVDDDDTQDFMDQVKSTYKRGMKDCMVSMKDMSEEGDSEPDDNAIRQTSAQCASNTLHTMIETSTPHLAAAQVAAGHLPSQHPVAASVRVVTSSTENVRAGSKELSEQYEALLSKAQMTSEVQRRVQDAAAGRAAELAEKGSADPGKSAERRAAEKVRMREQYRDMKKTAEALVDAGSEVWAILSGTMAASVETCRGYAEGSSATPLADCMEVVGDSVSDAGKQGKAFASDVSEAVGAVKSPVETSVGAVAAKAAANLKDHTASLKATFGKAMELVGDGLGDNIDAKVTIAIDEKFDDVVDDAEEAAEDLNGDLDVATAQSVLQLQVLLDSE